MSKKDREFRRILPTDFYFPIAYKFDRDVQKKETDVVEIHWKLVPIIFILMVI